MAEADGAWGDSLAAVSVEEVTKKVEETQIKPAPAAVSEATKAALETGGNDDTPEPEGEDAPAPVTAISGIHPEDQAAEVEITVAGDTVQPTIYQAVQKFEELNLSKELLQGVYGMQFTRPSKIQAQALPIILSANKPNLIGQAHHGSGKTAAYSLGLLSVVDPSINEVQAMCLVPTRELANQVYSVMSTLGKFTNIKFYAAIPGCTKGQKVTEQIVIGTPGTILAKLRNKEIIKNHIRIFVADEADQMIDMQGLGEQTLKVKKQLDKNCQILLFSATFADKVQNFAQRVAPHATKIHVKRDDLTLDNINQYYIDCGTDEKKYEVLTNIYGLLNLGQSIIFVHTVKTAKELANRMIKEGFAVSLLHGKDMDVVQRDAVMEDYRTGKTTVLITTNVLARGIDVLQTTLVVNYDVPLVKGRPDPETYIHRIGRSGRFGRKGVAINFVSDVKSKKDLHHIAQYYNKDIIALPADDLDKVEEQINKDLK